MAEEKKDRGLTTQTGSDSSLLGNLTRTLRLVMRLMGDSRVNILLKMMPLGALGYLILPEPIPVVDDALVLGLGTYVFIELCPAEVVEEHRIALWGPEAAKSDKVVDADFKDKPKS